MDKSYYEEEEVVVYLDFESYVAPEELENLNLDFKIIGVDAENPIVQVNGKLFKGTYDYSTGTNVFLDEDPSPPVVDPLYEANPRQFFKICAKSTKVLKMERLYVEKVVPSGERSGCEIINELKIRKTPNMTYSEALNMLLQPDQAPPRFIHDGGQVPFIAENPLADGNMNDDSQEAAAITAAAALKPAGSSVGTAAAPTIRVKIEKTVKESEEMYGIDE